MITAALILAVLALLIALGAAVLAFLTMRQSGAVATTLQRHRLGHKQREGREDPSAGEERRRLNLGPSRAVGERRASPGHVLPPEDSWTPPDAEPSTAAMPRLPRPGEIGRTR